MAAHEKKKRMRLPAATRMEALAVKGRGQISLRDRSASAQLKVDPSPRWQCVGLSAQDRIILGETALAGTPMLVTGSVLIDRYCRTSAVFQHFN